MKEDSSMDVFEAIMYRKSIRAFRPTIVSNDVLIDVLKTAIRAPSSVNLQPWEFVVVKGACLEALRSKNVEEYRSGSKACPEIPLEIQERGGTAVLGGIFRERRIALARQMFALLGISMSDKKRQSEHMERMMGYYGAPAVIIVLMDECFVGAWPMIDIGLVTQNIALAALPYGLGTCVMRAIIDYPAQVRKTLRVPESKRIVIGIAIGYPDWEHPINRLKTDREKVENVIKFMETL